MTAPRRAANFALRTMANSELHETARAIVAPGKGILAADESFPTIAKRLAAIGVESSEEVRRSYRQMLFTAPGAPEFISGVIMFDETVRQKTDGGQTFPEFMREHGIAPGIKVDRGAKALAGSDGEKVTEGLDGLRDRVAEYYELGCRFAKWRAVIQIGAGKPSDYCLEANAHALARYAALCQEGGLVPIVEPEVLMDGDHDVETCHRVTRRALHLVFDQLYRQNVDLEGILLKPNMVLSGKGHTSQAGVDEVADRTVAVLEAEVPASVPGIVFLSGGQSDELATAHLDAMNRRHPQAPWALSFSYGRALQHPALTTWHGDAGKIEAGANAFLKRARLNSAAARGAYEAAMEQG